LVVIPAEAGIHFDFELNADNRPKIKMGSSFRWNDGIAE
jgi:hypothetical protein